MVYLRGLSGPPVAIPLNQPEYRELKIWLEEQAKEYERTLHKEIMYRLKLAMRAGGRGECAGNED